MIQDILNAALAPLMEPTGWQAFAYGLLGIKTISRTVSTIKSVWSDIGPTGGGE